MSGEYRARGGDWAQQEKWGPKFTDARCLLELRSRVEWLEATQHAHLDASQLSEAEREAMTEPGRVEALERRCEVQLQQLGDLQDSHRRLASSVRMLEREVVTDAEVPDAPPPLRCPGAHTIAECGGPCEQDFRLCDCGLLQQLNPAGSLVERVAKAIHPDRCADPNLYLHEARAAIREVAAWLRGESDGHLGSGAHWARCMEQEADR